MLRHRQSERLRGLKVDDELELHQLRGFLVTEHLKSVLVVTPGFRSQRSSLVYHAVLGPASIAASCVPLFGEKTPKNWSQTWHGIQDIIKNWFKL